MRRLVVAVLAAFAFMSASVSGVAVPATAASGSVELAQAQGAWDQDTVFKFAKAALNVRNVFANHKKELKNAKSKQAKKQLEKTIQREVRNAIDNAGLSVSTYKKINKAMKQDRELRRRVTQLVNKMGGS